MVNSDRNLVELNSGGAGGQCIARRGEICQRRAGECAKKMGAREIGRLESESHSVGGDAKCQPCLPQGSAPCETANEEPGNASGAGAAANGEVTQAWQGHQPVNRQGGLCSRAEHALHPSGGAAWDRSDRGDQSWERSDGVDQGGRANGPPKSEGGSPRIRAKPVSQGSDVDGSRFRRRQLHAPNSAPWRHKVQVAPCSLQIRALGSRIRPSFERPDFRAIPPTPLLTASVELPPPDTSNAFPGGSK